MYFHPHLIHPSQLAILSRKNRVMLSVPKGQTHAHNAGEYASSHK